MRAAFPARAPAGHMGRRVAQACAGAPAASLPRAAPGARHAPRSAPRRGVWCDGRSAFPRAACGGPRRPRSRPRRRPPRRARRRRRDNAALVRREQPVRGDAILAAPSGQGGVGATAAGRDVAFVDLEIWHLFCCLLAGATDHALVRTDGQVPAPLLLQRLRTACDDEFSLPGIRLRNKFVTCATRGGRILRRIVASISIASASVARPASTSST